MNLAKLIEANPKPEDSVELTGYLTQGRRKNSSFLFFDLRDKMTDQNDDKEPKVQLVLKEWETEDFKNVLKNITVGSHVSLSGKIQKASPFNSNGLCFEVLVNKIAKVGEKNV